MATRIAGLYATKIVLETQLADVASDALVAQAARNAHMIRDGEKLLVVLTPPGNTPVAEETPSVEVTRTSPKPWDIWYDLFFGD